MTTKTAATSRRAFPRVPTDIPVQVVRPDAFSLDPFAATLLDISQNGAMVLCRTTIPLGEWIVIRPDHKGAGFGEEIVAIVDRTIPADSGQVKLACRFPVPLDYSVLRLFM